MTPYEVVFGTCFSCRRPFTFNPYLVPSIPIDPETGRPPDMGGDASRARREPVCPDCIGRANAIRRADGRPLIDVLPGAYEPRDVGI